MSGGGGPTNSTVTQSNVPDWLRPQVEGMLTSATSELFNTEKVDTGRKDEAGNPIYETKVLGSKPFVPYSTNPQDYVAGFSPLQQQVQYNAANLQMPSQFNYATNMANAAGQGAMDSANQAYGYGNAGFQSGQLGQQLGTAGGQYYGDLSSQIGLMGLDAQQTGSEIGNLARGYAADAARAGSDYAKTASNVYNPRTGQYEASSTTSSYMNPYLENVLDIQNEAAIRNAGIARTQRGAQAAKAGAFGGARQAIENAEAERALQSTLNANTAQGYQAAYDKAMQAQQFGANLGIQGLAGANQGLGTALQGGQLGLSGMGTALQGQQGALQGVNTALAGTGQGMQGAGVGLQGVGGAQAGYGLANQSAGTLGQLGTQQLAAQTGILNLQNQIGGQQQSQEQQIINQGIQNFANAQQQPMNNLNQYNALLRGYALPGTTTTQYQAQPTLANQMMGFGTAGVSALALNNALNPASGSDIRVKENIERVGTLANGLGLYDFEYKPEFKNHPLCGHGRFRGVMAQEVEKLIPEAVVTMDNGYKAVKYNLVELS